MFKEQSNNCMTARRVLFQDNNKHTNKPGYLPLLLFYNLIQTTPCFMFINFVVYIFVFLLEPFQKKPIETFKSEDGKLIINIIIFIFNCFIFQ